MSNGVPDERTPPQTRESSLSNWKKIITIERHKGIEKKNCSRNVSVKHTVSGVAVVAGWINQ